MPITPLFEWQESDATITVVATVPGLSREHADVTATDCMLKVNCPPYLLLIDLHDEVDDSRSVATLTPGVVTFTLVKKLPCLWGRLAASGERELLTRRRNASVDRAHARLEALRVERLELKKKEDQAATNRQIDVERRKRQEIERRKAEELLAEREALQGWQEGLGADSAGSAPRPKGARAPRVKAADAGNESDYESDEEAAAAAAAPPAADPAPAAPDHPDYHGRGYRREKAHTDARRDSAAAGTSGRRRGGAGSGEDSSDSGGDGDSGAAGRAAARRSAQQAEQDVEEEPEDAMDRWERAMREVAPPGGWDAPLPVATNAIADQSHKTAMSFTPLPPPRTRLQPVPVSFTALETGHLPARQTREAEIKEYKRKEGDRRLLADSADIADRQPVFLKDKGDALFAQGNYRGALNAYSRALELDPRLPAVWSNSAACYLKLDEPGLCDENAGGALMLLEAKRVKMEANELGDADAAALRKTLVRALVRRGQARGQLGRYPEAAADYMQALKYDRGNVQLEADLQELLAAAQPADAAALRVRGDARFRAGDHEGAAHAYAALVGLPPALATEAERIAALSNRAACFIVLERYQHAVADCNTAMGLALPQLLLGASATAAAISNEADAPRSASANAILPLTAGVSSTGSSGAVDAQALLVWAQSAAEHARGAGLEAPPAEPLDTARLTCIGRLMSRRGAAHTYLKHPAEAADDLTAAAALLRLAGEDAARVEQLLADAANLRGQGGSTAAVTAATAVAATPVPAPTGRIGAVAAAAVGAGVAAEQQEGGEERRAGALVGDGEEDEVAGVQTGQAEGEAGECGLRPCGDLGCVVEDVSATVLADATPVA